MSTFDMNNAIDVALKMDVYAIYLRKSRADLEAEKLGEVEILDRHKKILTELAARKGFYIGKIYKEIVSRDDNIYRTRNCALNAVDKILGVDGIKRRSKRMGEGIDIIGKEKKSSLNINEKK